MTEKFYPQGTKTETEEGTVFAPKFDDNGLIPCIVQDESTNEIVMFAFMNEASLAKSIETGEAWYWSRSRSKLWHKGATSGSIQTISEIRTDCDQDVILIKVSTAGDGSNCHRRVKSCFYRTMVANPSAPQDSALKHDLT